MRKARTTLTTVIAIGLLAGSTVGVAAQTEEASGEVTPFEGVMPYGSNSVSGTPETLPNGVVTNRGQVWTLSSDGLSDPRLQGTVSNMWNWDEYRSDRHTVWRGGFRIENDDGAWQMRPIVNLSFPDSTYSVWTGIFDGEGEYEGLTAIAEVAEGGNQFTVRGVVIEGEIPPAPESMSTE